jgi:hypothetical protein
MGGTMWIWDVLTSEFFWGVIVGLILSIVGAYFLALFSAKQQRQMQKETVRSFCADTIKNLRQIVDEMSDLRARMKVIHHDYLAAMDVEFNVFGRNREHIIHLPEQVRDRVRKFVTDCAVRRAEIGNFLGQFNQLCRLGDELESQGRVAQAQTVRNQANGPLANAGRALDDLVTRVQDSTNLVNDIKSAA